MRGREPHPHFIACGGYIRTATFLFSVYRGLIGVSPFPEVAEAEVDGDTDAPRHLTDCITHQLFLDPVITPCAPNSNPKPQP